MQIIRFKIMSCFMLQQCLLGCKPGDIIKKTDLKMVKSSLDNLANEGWQNRKCMVGFVNVADKTMNNPRFYLKDGMIKTMPQYELPAGRTVLLLFTKTTCECVYNSMYSSSFFYFPVHLSASLRNSFKYFSHTNCKLLVCKI